MKKRHLLAIGILIAGAGLATVLVMSRPEPGRDEQRSPSPLVETAEVETRDGALELATTGTVRARRRVRLAPQVGGRVVAVSPKLESGLRVPADEILVRIEPADFLNAVEQARAEVARQEVAVMEARERSAVAERELEQFQKQAEMLDLDAGPANRPLLLRRPQLEAAKAALARAEARLKDAQLALDRTELEVPFAGYVLSESVDVGDYLAPGTAVAEIFDAAAVEVVVPLTDDQVALVEGLWGDASDPSEATVLSDFGSGRFRWPAVVDRAEAALDEQTRTYDVLLIVEDPFESGVKVEGRAEQPVPPLLPGAFVDVRIRGADVGRHFELPRRALRRNDTVWKVDSSAHVHVVPVEVLQTVDGTVLVRGGLAAGDRVVLTDLQVVTDGMKVRLAETTSSEPGADGPDKGTADPGSRTGGGRRP